MYGFHYSQKNQVAVYLYMYKMDVQGFCTTLFYITLLHLPKGALSDKDTWIVTPLPRPPA